MTVTGDGLRLPLREQLLPGPELLPLGSADRLFAVHPELSPFCVSVDIPFIQSLCESLRQSLFRSFLVCSLSYSHSHTNSVAYPSPLHSSLSGPLCESLRDSRF